MTRIDRYLLGLYTRVLGICFASVSGLLIVVHVFSNLEEFLRFTEQSESTLLSVLVEYYGPYTLSIFERLSGLLALMALLFVVAWLNKTHEFTALQAAGVTKRRVVRPLLLASMVVILTAAGLREFSIPKYQDRLDRNPQDLTGDLPRQMRPTFDHDATALLQGRHLLPINMKIVSPMLKVQGGPLAKPVGSKVVAKTAVFQPATVERPQGYLFQEVTLPRAIDEVDSVLKTDGTPLLLTSKDNDWIEAGDCFFASEIDFEMLRGGSAWKQFASTSELIAHLRGEHQRRGNDVRVQIHQRILRPATDWTVLLLGIPVLLTRPDRHMFWVAGACLFIVAGFSAVVLGLSAVATASPILAPATACWLPLLLFLPWGWARTSAAMET